MRAISLHQPWATLVALGIKQTETRHWATDYRGPLAIHAAKKWDHACKEAAAGFARTHPDHRVALLAPPRGAIVAVVRMVDCFAFRAGLPSYVTDADYDCGDMTPGRFGWKFEGHQAISPIPEKGRQRFWNLKGKVLELVQAQVKPDHVAWSCDMKKERTDSDYDCTLAYCERHHGCLFICAVCNQAEAELEPFCPGAAS